MESTVIRAVEVVLGYGVVFGLFWAYYDSSKFTAAQFQATGKMRRLPWLIALGGAVVLVFWLGGFRFADPVGGRSLVWLAAVLTLLVYLFDLRPKLEEQRFAGA